MPNKMLVANVFGELAKTIDWNLLYEQKMRVNQMMVDRSLVDAEEINTVNGLLNLLDSMGDAAEKAGLWSYPKRCPHCGEVIEDET